jgi:hypothetical protein
MRHFTEETTTWLGSCRILAYSKLVGGILLIIMKPVPTVLHLPVPMIIPSGLEKACNRSAFIALRRAISSCVPRRAFPNRPYGSVRVLYYVAAVADVKIIIGNSAGGNERSRTIIIVGECGVNSPAFAFPTLATTRTSRP